MLRRTGDLQGSAAEIQKAKELAQAEDRRSDADAHMKAAAQYIRKNDTADAIKELRLALAAEPDSPDANHLLGVALSTAGNWTEADKAFKTALQMKPSDPQIHFNFGVSLGHQQDWQGAAREFRSAVSLPARVCAGPLLTGQCARSHGRRPRLGAGTVFGEGVRCVRARVGPRGGWNF